MTAFGFDRFGEILGRMVLAHTRQLGAHVLRVGTGGRERLAVDRVTLVALEADEHLAATLRVTTLGQREFPTARHAAALVQLLHRGSMRRRGSRGRVLVAM